MVSHDAQSDIGFGGHNPLYGMRNDSETNLIAGAADMAVTTPGEEAPRYLRDESLERRAPGFLGGGPGGYGGLPQQEDEADPMSYDYFRSRRRNPEA
jgi:hypothetical protein